MCSRRPRHAVGTCRMFATIIFICLIVVPGSSEQSLLEVQVLGSRAGAGARLCPKGLEPGMTAFLLSPQNVGGGTAVVQVRATDRDIGINSVLSYYITGGNEDMTFRMDRVSGEIATRPAPPDRERQSFYHLVVTVEDEGTPTLLVSDRGRPLGEEAGGGWLRCLCHGMRWVGVECHAPLSTQQLLYHALNPSACEYFMEGLCVPS